MSESANETSSRDDLSTLTDSQKENLLKSVEDADEVLWCSGSVSCPFDTLPLFYKVRGQSHGGGDSDTDGRDENVVKCVDLFSATPTELDTLSKACDPATFGMNQENVLDETYRKARKLDLENFALNFSPEELGFHGIIKKALLTPTNRTIVFEKYKINIYGEGSFFKTHKDTPRSQGMFGSLVIVFPTAHEGGSLIVSHKDRSSTVDFAEILKDKVDNSVAFAAFYSDVDHEVSKVTTGYRVSLTFNLYYDYDDGNRLLNKIVHISTNTSYERVYAKLQTELSRLLQDSTFLPKGGLLGFMLRHEYPIPDDSTKGTWQSRPGQDGRPLEPLKNLLKGSDAILYKVCVDLGLPTALKFAYDGDHWDGSTHLYYLSDYGLEPAEDRRYNVMYSTLRKSCLEVNTEKDFTWVRNKQRPGDGTFFQAPYIAYGNQWSLGYIYGSISLIVGVGTRDRREWFDFNRYLMKKFTNKPSEDSGSDYDD